MRYIYQMKPRLGAHPPLGELYEPICCSVTSDAAAPSLCTSGQSRMPPPGDCASSAAYSGGSSLSRAGGTWDWLRRQPAFQTLGRMVWKWLLSAHCVVGETNFLQMVVLWHVTWAYALERFWSMLTSRSHLERLGLLCQAVEWLG